MPVKGSFSTEINIDLEYFPIELEVNQNDVQEPVVFAPIFPLAEDHEPAKAQVDLAWKRFAESIGSTPEEKLNYDEKINHLDKTSLVKFISLKDDKNDETAIISDNLKPLRYGLATFRVYGPEKAKFWEDQQNDCTKSKLKEFDLHKDEQLMLMSGLNESLIVMDELFYNIKLKLNDSGGTDKDLFQEMRVYEEARCGFCEFDITIKFLNRFYQRKFIVPTNRGKFLLAAKDNPVQKQGRKEELRREMLVFSGDTKKQIKYWYIDDRKRKQIKILSWSKFKDLNGRDLKDPNKNNEGNTLPTNFNKKNKGDERWETTFYAPLRCWGSILVEYSVDYTEWKVLYDIPGAKQEFEITAGSIEKIGFNTFTKAGDLIEYSAYLNIYLELEDESDWDKNASRAVLLGMEKTDIEQLLKDGKLKFEGFDDFRVVEQMSPGVNSTEPPPPTLKKLDKNPVVYFLRDQDLDTGIIIRSDDTVEVKAFDEFTYAELYAVRSFNKLKMRPFKVAPLKVLVTNGRRMIDYSFTPPAPTFISLSEKELPRACIYEERVVERIYPDPNNFAQYLDIEHLQEMNFVDIWGNTTSESLTKFNPQNEQRVADFEGALQQLNQSYDVQYNEYHKKVQEVQKRYESMMDKIK